jgi:hypothetical protein
MKKLLYVIPALLLCALIATPNARADSYTPTFSCNGPVYNPYLTCVSDVSPPSAPSVAFPAPTIDISSTGAGNADFDITLASADSPTDQYSWALETGQEPCPIGFCNVGTFYIRDVTTGISSESTTEDIDFSPDPAYGYYGSLTFSPVSASAPEPASIVLMLLGIGLIVLMRKRFILRMPQTTT